MKRYLIVQLTVLMMLFSVCGGEEETPVPTPTAVPVMTAVQANDAELNGADDEVSTASEAVAEEGVEEPSADDAPADGSSSDVASAGNDGQQRGMGGMMGGGMMGGMGPEMRARHMAPIPAEYAGLTSPVAADAESIARGQAHFNQFCASCHGNAGLGDGPAAASLDPAPPMIAQTSLMLGDDMLFWRISEGGAFEPFNSAMPAWKAILDEEARWDVINYARSLGGGDATMGGDGAMRDEMQAAMQDEMLAAGIGQGVINEADAETFRNLHAQIDAYRAAEDGMTGNMDEILDQLLAAMVDDGQLSQADADAFADIHARLSEAGLMP